MLHSATCARCRVGFDVCMAACAPASLRTGTPAVVPQHRSGCPPHAAPPQAPANIPSISPLDPDAAGVPGWCPCNGADNAHPTTTEATQLMPCGSSAAHTPVRPHMHEANAQSRGGRGAHLVCMHDGPGGVFDRLPGLERGIRRAGRHAERLRRLHQQVAPPEGLLHGVRQRHLRVRDAGHRHLHARRRPQAAHGNTAAGCGAPRLTHRPMHSVDRGVLSCPCCAGTRERPRERR